MILKYQMVLGLIIVIFRVDTPELEPVKIIIFLSYCMKEANLQTYFLPLKIRPHAEDIFILIQAI